MPLNIAGTKSVINIGFTSTSYVTNGATATMQIDALGYDYAAIDIYLNGANTTSNAPSAVFLGEADVTNTSSASTINAFNGATATATNVGFLIPVTGVVTGATGVNAFRMNVDLRPRKRYLLVSVSPVTTQQVMCHALLGRAEAIPVSASNVNVQALVEG